MFLLVMSSQLTESQKVLLFVTLNNTQEIKVLLLDLVVLMPLLLVTLKIEVKLD
jgi:hypothetical protein